MNTPEQLAAKLKSWALYESKKDESGAMPYPFADLKQAEADKNDPKVSFRAWMHQHMPTHAAELYRMIPGDVGEAEPRPDESSEAHERRMVMAQAREDTLRSEARADRRAVLYGAMACTAGALIVPWAVGILALCGVEHLGLLVPGVLTTLALALGAGLLFQRHAGMRTAQP